MCLLLERGLAICLFRDRGLVRDNGLFAGTVPARALDQQGKGLEKMVRIR